MKKTEDKINTEKMKSLTEEPILFTMSESGRDNAIAFLTAI